jgi:hypothetical protein
VRTVKRIAIVFVALMIVVPFLAGPASAREKGVRRYRAETSDGQFLRFRTVRDDGRRRLDGLFFGESRETLGLQLTCEDGTTVTSHLSGLTQFPWFFEGDTVTVDEIEPPYFALHLVGTFQLDSASGTFRFNDVFVDDDVTSAQVCTTGDLTWTAERVG